MEKKITAYRQITARYEQILSPSIGNKWFETSRHINTANDFIQYGLCISKSSVTKITVMNKTNNNII